MFNRWRKFKLEKKRTHPKEWGYYQCTVIISDDIKRVMDLFYDPIDGGCWIDKRRVSVFMGYKAYLAGKVPSEENRVFSDSACDRTLAVTAWRKLPKPYGLKKKGTN